MSDSSSEDEELFASDSEDESQSFPQVHSVADFGNDEVKKKKKKTSGGFQSMGLRYEVLRGILKKGYKVPTPIQRKVIPVLLQGLDAVAMARTGSGKTAAFLVPLFQRLNCHSGQVGCRAVILSPTRELAIQTMKFASEIGQFTDLRACLLVGGDNMDEQFAQLSRNPDIIIATPGRLLHHMIEVDLTLGRVEYIVFDEADRLFEMGLKDQIDQIMHKVNRERQTVLVSATMPQLLVDFARVGLKNPTLIRLDAEMQLPPTLGMTFFTTRSEDKAASLLYLLTDFLQPMKPTIVFVATKHHVEFISELLQRNNITSSVIFGTMDQSLRTYNVGRFKKGKTMVLIVTDLAARGIDIPLIDNVINYDFPSKPKLFVHRVGRAARAGRPGFAYSLVGPDEMSYLVELHLFLGKKLICHDRSQKVDKISVSGYGSDPSYYGNIPTQLIETYTEKITYALTENAFARMDRTVKNATKMYVKTREAAAPESVRRAKELPLPEIHPLLLEHVDGDEVERQSFIRHIQGFRPKETIFEISAKQKLNTETGKFTMSIMNSKRNQHSGVIEAERFKRSQRPEKVSDQPPVSLNSASHPPQEDPDSEDELAKKPEDLDATANSLFGPVGSKRERPFALENTKRKNKHAKTSESSSVPSDGAFKDKEFYLSYHKDSQHRDQGLAVNKGKSSFNQDIESSVMDLIPDDPDGIFKKRNVMQWDKKTKKYVRGDNKKGLLVRNESGTMVEAKKSDRYEKWKKKSKRMIQKEGERESSYSEGDSIGGWRKQLQVMKYHQNKPAEVAPPANGRPLKDELKTPEQIAKERRLKEAAQKKSKQQKVRSEKRRVHAPGSKAQYKSPKHIPKRF
eukprot:TRINITY_DN8178_c0_g1_i1.p1 TRINITY_DN8178_c0_g1~~TRINITY_DN8178_c0_g1_i1.p1  ORF type:complete len:902 (+),score=445.68 TRINITY_DN8178_c0_g1_i1:148-2706(+)